MLLIRQANSIVQPSAAASAASQFINIDVGSFTVAAAHHARAAKRRKVLATNNGHCGMGNTRDSSTTGDLLTGRRAATSRSI